MCNQQTPVDSKSDMTGSPSLKVIHHTMSLSVLYCKCMLPVFGMYIFTWAWYGMYILSLHIQIYNGSLLNILFGSWIYIPCAGFLSFVYICIAIGDPAIKKGGWNPINQFNPAIFLCLFQARTCISNVMCHGLFCVQWVQLRGGC